MMLDCEESIMAQAPIDREWQIALDFIKE